MRTAFRYNPLPRCALLGRIHVVQVQQRRSIWWASNVTDSVKIKIYLPMIRPSLVYDSNTLGFRKCDLKLQAKDYDIYLPNSKNKVRVYFHSRLIATCGSGAASVFHARLYRATVTYAEYHRHC